MEEIINDLKSAYDKLNVEVVKAEAKSKELDVKLNALKEKEAKIVSRETSVLASEEKLKDIQNVADAKEAVSKSRVELNAEKQALAEANKALSASKATIEAKEKELAQFIGIYKQKTAYCDAYKTQLEADRAKMKESILEELKKGLK